MRPTERSPQQRRRDQRTARAGSLPDPRVPDDAALVERMMKLRTACHGLATDLASANRRLKAAERELRALKQRER